MNDVPILPNPFKLLDMQRDKQSNINKCTSCDDKDDYQEDKSEFIEGHELMIAPSSWTAMLLAVSVTIVGGFLWLFAWNASNMWNNRDMIDFIKYLNNNETGDKDAYQAVLKSVTRMSRIMVFFIALTAFFLGVFVLDLSDNKLASGVIIGVISILVLGLPQLATYFENTIGYFLITPFLDLKMWMKSDNFDKLVKEDFNNGSIASINFNPLITLFSLENLPEAFEKMRFGTDENERSRQDFFVALDAERGDMKERGDFFKYLFEYTLKKNIIGNCVWIGLATSIACMV